MDFALKKMSVNPGLTFQRIAAWSLIATAFTTLIPHLVNFPVSSFEESVALYKNQGYVLRNNIVVVHCLLVVISMLGLGLMEIKRKTAWVMLGFIFFLVFGLAEIGRMGVTNVVVNGLRENYSLGANAQFNESSRFLLESVWPLVGTFLFRVFIVAFSLGSICYGIVFIDKKWIGRIFLVWGIVNLFAFANDFVQWDWLGESIGIFSFTYQPLARLTIGVWFLRTIR